MIPADLRTVFIFLLCSATFVPALAQSAAENAAYNGKKNIVCSNGAVVSAHPLASQAGVQMLKAGGNAFDAAISTQLMLAVVYPEAGNIGGGGFMVARLGDGKTISIDFREKAPAAASKNMYLDKAGNASTDLSQNGHLSAGIPGAVAGLFAQLKYARLPMKKLIQPAIDIAEKGFCITAKEAAALNEVQNEFKKYSTRLPVFVKAGGWKTGDTLIQKDLAKTLRLIRDLGASGFYEGETARLITEEIKRGNGLISEQDLKTYTVAERKPMVFDYKEYSIITMPLPSSGGILLPQMMRMVEDQPLQSYGFESVRAVHLMTEVERLSYADRAKYMGDPDFVKVPVNTLISYPYLYQRMENYPPDSAGSSQQIREGQIDAEHVETTHLNVYDKEGNAISITTTLNGNYGSRTVVAGAGFILNNEMDDFSIKPGVPNMYGAVGGTANAIAPGKRMLSSMSPTIVLKNNKPFLVIGTPGGTTIPTSVFQTMIDIMEFNMSPEDAVNKPKFHHQWLPDVVYVEPGFSKITRDQLTKIGYHIEQVDEIGRFELIEIGPAGIQAVADGRGRWPGRRRGRGLLRIPRTYTPLLLLLH